MPPYRPAIAAKLICSVKTPIHGGSPWVVKFRLMRLIELLRSIPRRKRTILYSCADLPPHPRGGLPRPACYLALLRRPAAAAACSRHRVGRHFDFIHQFDV